MTGPDFTPIERQVLETLMDPDIGPTDRTVEAVVERTGLDGKDVRTALVKMEAEEAVQSEHDAVTHVEFWIALNEAAERLDPPLEG